MSDKPPVTLLHGDNRDLLKGLPDNSIDAVVTDPPSGISFMGRDWDTDKGGRRQWIAWLAETMGEVLRVVKPGGYALVWALPRTSHWTATALEDAGWEIRDIITHLYGCLSADTEILTTDGWKQYQEIESHHFALGYDASSGTYEWMPVQEVFVYDYCDTAYRIHSDNTDQLVSRNHRCLVERGGRFVFEYAEALKQQEDVPILENLPGLLEAVPLSDERAGSPQEVLLECVPEGRSCKTSSNARAICPVPKPKGCRQGKILDNGNMRNLRKSIPTQENTYQSRQADILLNEMQWGSTREGVGQTRLQGESRTNTRRSSLIQSQNERCKKSRMEGRGDVQETSWQPQGSSVCALPTSLSANVTERWLCDGASPNGSPSNRALPDTGRSSSPHQSQQPGQSPRELDAVCEQHRTQAVRGEGYTVSDLATISPEHYQGKVWCVKVRTGAFVARRNGKAFVTGNSGFPKSYNVSKGIESVLVNGSASWNGFHTLNGELVEGDGRGANGMVKTNAAQGNRPTEYKSHGTLKLDPTTEQAKQWKGWGSALKPSSEHWILCRKPFSEPNTAKNILKWGTGAINIDGCRIPATDTRGGGFGLGKAPWEKGAVGGNSQYINGQDLGRWPANTIFACSCETEPRANGESDEHLPGCPVGKLDRQSGRSKSSDAVRNSAARQGNSMGREYGHTSVGHADEGGASRFFFVAKPSPAERNYGCEELEAKDAADLTGRSPGSPGERVSLAASHDQSGTTGAAPRQNVHPTVKSISLMSHLVRLVCPPNGTVLDPFMGSGTTGMASVLEGFDFIGMEQSEEYHAIARCRVAWAQEQVVAKADAKKDLPLTLDFDAH